MHAVVRDESPLQVRVFAQYPQILHPDAGVVIRNVIFDAASDLARPAVYAARHIDHETVAFLRRHKLSKYDG
jgi:hypothetical protein